MISTTSLKNIPVSISLLHDQEYQNLCFKITEKRRLRIIDLTIYPDKAMFRTNKKDSSFLWVI